MAELPREEIQGCDLLNLIQRKLLLIPAKSKKSCMMRNGRCVFPACILWLIKVSRNRCVIVFPASV